MTDMLVMVTSRGRPHQFVDLVDTIRATSMGVRVVAVLDDDDPTLDDYPLDRADIEVEVGPRLGHAQSMNRCAVAHADEVDIIGQLGDDHRPRTVGWERMVAAALTTTGIAYGDDLYQRVALPTAVWMTTDIVRALGHFCPPTLWHLFVDNYWLDLGVASGCLRYLPGVVVEHLHPDAGKADVDDTYTESWQWVTDEVAWNDYRESGRLHHDVAVVRGLVGW